MDDQPFPHTLPINSTPYANNASNSTGAGYDGPGECLKHVLGHGDRLYPAPLDHLSPRYWRQIDVSEFVTDGGVGMYSFAWLLVPPACEQESEPEPYPDPEPYPNLRPYLTLTLTLNI